MATKLNAVLRAELAKLDAEQMLELLGEIVQPSIDTPFAVEDDAFTDALLPVEQAYSAAFAGLQAAALGEDTDPDAKFWNEADRRYDEARDARADITDRDLPY